TRFSRDWSSDVCSSDLLTGTDYRAPVTDPALTAARPYWNRRLPSESPEVYRAEHLAARLLHEHGPDALNGTDDLAALVRGAAERSEERRVGQAGRHREE